jgi:endonuclease YncB( thermonuclease family)
VTIWAYPRVTILSVVDGDTARADLDLGCTVWLRGQLLRLNGCNARELHDQGGPEARDNLAALMPPGTVVDVTVVGFDKYSGRLDAQITLPDGRDLVTLLIATGWAAPWNGLGPKPSPIWPRLIKGA